MIEVLTFTNATAETLPDVSPTSSANFDSASFVGGIISALALEL